MTNNLRVYNKVNKVATVLWFSGCVRLYKNGDTFDGLFRAWHPVTWLVYIAAVVPCALAGEKLSAVVPISLSEFWKNNIDQLQYVTPYTLLSDITPFNFSKRHIP